MKQSAGIFLFICLFVGSGLQAQTFNFRTYSEDEGLPQSYVYSISQSKSGFLSISTGDGFSSFGGDKFKTFTIADSLAENFTTIHFEDSRGFIWLGHYQKGISYYKDSRFYKVKGSEEIGTTITAFAEDVNKNIWVGTKGKGIFKIDGGMNITPVETDLSNIAGLSFDKQGHLIAATSQGLAVLEVLNQKIKVICIPEALKDKKITAIIPGGTSRDTFWVAIDGEGVEGLTITGSCVTPIVKISSELKSQDLKISSLYLTRTGVLWVGLFGEGARKIFFPDPRDKKNFYVRLVAKKNGLPNDYIQCIFEDVEGNMWFGTFGGGLVQLPLDKFMYYDSQSGVVGNNVTAVLIDKKRNTWLGNPGGLNLFSIDPAIAGVQFDKKAGFVTDRVTALLEDNAGKIWIGTASNGIWNYDPEKKMFDNFSARNKLTFLTVNCIAKSSSGTVIIGTTEGAYFYYPSGKLETYTTNEGMLHNNIRHIYADKTDRIWFSSHGTPPYFIKNGEVTVLKDIPGMKSFDINCITGDKKGNIWIATEGDGIFKYDGKKFSSYKVDNGLLSNFCYSIISDKNNGIWVTHKNGLSNKQYNNKEPRTFRRSDGLIYVENNLNTVDTDFRGRLWFGTTTGIVIYDPEKDKGILNEPFTHILSVKINDQVYSANEKIDLPYGSYSARFDYIGVSFINPVKVTYKYRLLGFDSLWRVTNERFIEFPKLADGNYTFQLESCNSEGRWNFKPVNIHFTIDAPIWKKAWFYLLVLVAIIFITYGLVMWRTRRLLKAKLILEFKVKEKTKQLREEKEIVEQIKTVLEEKNKNITDSISYAKRIQESMLPSRNSILNIFPESFIFYEPRDIVSGDFYWFTETSDSYMIAVVDCTGHGVPGAFMSLIGSTLLHEIVTGKGITRPSDVLTELNKAIVHSLNQEGIEQIVHDGMDMALCKISKEKTGLIYAGALRPLYLVREGSLTELKGNPYSLGGHFIGLDKEFTETEIDLRKGDTLYMFSDGYTDQFGLHAKKFSSKRLKELLTGISATDMDLQLVEIKESFDRWKGKEKQVDDVLLMGLRI